MLTIADRDRFINDGPFFAKYPDVFKDVTRYEFTDANGRVIESWERGDDGRMHETTKRETTCVKRDYCGTRSIEQIGGKGVTTGEKIRRLRCDAGMTQKELADKVGCNHWTIYRCENGKNKIRLYTLELIADALNTTVKYLLEE